MIVPVGKQRSTRCELCLCGATVKLSKSKNSIRHDITVCPTASKPHNLLQHAGVPSADESTWKRFFEEKGRNHCSERTTGILACIFLNLQAFTLNICPENVKSTASRHWEKATSSLASSELISRMFRGFLLR